MTIVVLESVRRGLKDVGVGRVDILEFPMFGQPQEHLLDKVLDLGRIAGTLAEKAFERCVVAARKLVQPLADSVAPIG